MIETGFLKSVDGTHVLNLTSTTIGKENCDILLHDCTTEPQHAVIQYIAEEDSFLLHDLNSAHGTYVNECRIQNAGVRLAHGDLIKFGYNGQPFELQLNMKNTSCSPIQQQPSWNSPVQILVCPTNETHSLPQINLSPKTKMQTCESSKQSSVYPHPPLRSRPFSAGSIGKVMNPVTSLPPQRYIREAFPANPVESSLQDKEQKLMHMSDEINRLAVFEQESKRKDALICCLRDEIGKKNDHTGNEMSNKALVHKLQSVENEINSRRNEVTLLRHQLDSVNATMTSSPTLTSQLAEREKKINEMRLDLDRANKEYQMSQGLVQSLQKQIQNQESILAKKNSENTFLKKELKQKEIQLSSVSSKFTKLNEDKSKDEKISELNKDLKEIRIKKRTLENGAAEKLSLLQMYQDEVTKLKKKQDEENEGIKMAAKEAENLKHKYLELQRTERLLRVDLEQASSQHERFRTRILRSVYSSTGIHQPTDDGNITDEMLATEIRKIINERNELRNEVKDLKTDLEQNETQLEDLTNSHSEIAEEMNKILDTLTEKGHHSSILSEQIQILLSYSSDKNIFWAFEPFSKLMENERKWISTLEGALTDADCDVTFSNKHPAVHVSDIHKSLLSEREAHQGTLQSIADLESNHQRELQSHLNRLLQENEDKLSDELEKMRIQERSNFKQSLEEMRAKEEERRMEALMREREKTNSVNMSVEQLRKLLDEKIAEANEYKNKIQDVYMDVEKLKNIETQLTKDLTEQKHKSKTELLVVQENLNESKKKYESDIVQYKEEIHQHSITIVSLEEQLKALSIHKQNAEREVNEMRNRVKGKTKVCVSQEDQTTQTGQNTQMRHRSPTPPKSPPLPTVDVSFLEQNIAALQAELLHANQKLRIQDDVIIGLRNDLNGAQARISDMTGEMSESMKLELEHNRNQVKHQEIELNTIRQKLLRMSGLVDSQTQQIEKLNKDLKAKENDKVKKSLDLEKFNQDMKQLQMELESEKNKQQTTVDETKKEGKIASELTCIGAQCRGERHNDVIMRQREALAELRARLKTLEQIRPPLPSQEQALQQVILLKKELAEIRAKQAIEEDKHFQAQLNMDKGTVDAQQQIRTANTQASIERTAKDSLEESVVSSEQCYMDVVNCISGLLGVNFTSPPQSLQHVAGDVREKVCMDRRSDLDLISTRIKSLLQRLDRKEQLLQGYEKDLGKLREAEEFASQRSNKMETLVREITEKSSEVDHLREALTRTRESLELEKRLNKAIKQRKTYHLENLDVRTTPVGARSGYPNHDDVIREKEKRKRKEGKMRKRQYEIEVLKQKVSGKERDLCDTTARLANLSSSISEQPTDELGNIYTMRERNRKKAITKDFS